MIGHKRKAGRVAALCTLFAVVPLAGGCGGDDEDESSSAKPASGVFVGEVPGTGAFVAVTAAAATDGDAPRAVKTYVCDGKRLSEWLPGTASGDSFTATSDDGDAEVKGTLSGNAVTGTVELSDGKTLRFTARRATGDAGLYNLRHLANGQVVGESVAGGRVSGRSEARRPGITELTLPKGGQLRIKVTRDSVKPPDVPAGAVRLIVLANGRFAGAGKALKTTAGGGASFSVRKLFP